MQINLNPMYFMQHTRVIRGAKFLCLLLCCMYYMGTYYKAVLETMTSVNFAVISDDSGQLGPIIAYHYAGDMRQFRKCGRIFFDVYKAIYLMVIIDHTL